MSSLIRTYKPYGFVPPANSIPIKSLHAPKPANMCFVKNQLRRIYNKPFSPSMRVMLLALNWWLVSSVVLTRILGASKKPWMKRRSENHSWYVMLLVHAGVLEIVGSSTTIYPLPYILISCSSQIFLFVTILRYAFCIIYYIILYAPFDIHTDQTNIPWSSPAPQRVRRRWGWIIQRHGGTWFGYGSIPSWMLSGRCHGNGFHARRSNN